MKIVVAMALAATFAGKRLRAAEAAASPPAKPNIVFILADDLGYGDVSLLNPGDRIQTPNIDRLGREGMIFTDAHAASALCTPSRYAILTGRYPWRSRLKHGVLNGVSPHLIEDGRMTVASLLKAHGYNTALIGKWHLGVDWHFYTNTPQGQAHGKGKMWRIDYSQSVANGPLTKGFDYDDFIVASPDMWPFIYIQNDHAVGAATVTRTIDGRVGPAAPYYDPVKVLPHFTDEACAYIHRRAATKQPFFLYFAMTAPHTPIVPAAEFQGKSPLHFPYLDFCIEADAMVGRVLKAINDAGIADNTLVIFASDNGFAPYVDPHHFLEEHGDYPSYIFRGYKSDIWEGGHRIPFFVRWPGVVKAGTTNDAVICMSDFMATVADILHAKLPANAGEDSISLLPTLEGGKLPDQPIVDASLDGSLAIRDGKWKLEMCPGSGGWTLPNRRAKEARLPSEQLYAMNTKLGIREQFNVVGDHPQVAQRLRALLVKYIEDGRSTPGAPQHNDSPQVWPAVAWLKSVKPDSPASGATAPQGPEFQNKSSK